mmetsp:Transcript_90330/g.188906  ORF Transcript_90330/g.188906 Transcript_90330/m.188906 type:complete len:88 (+) Transcript_90330:150-413(+)|eukprot:CAMPEP_0206465208 /NCGR_PEP_ID=MMETSP0324_2-20121206/27687_1 /ASSEMBLY_ACC=CAM_ASM_000836 /TAXON_ID=2866 /ORGANISM="Crypthecodinium cohnii, Strain Seligo" /LENGTH=87 /DNA_ID=CAMNT_0053938011 /DNA_START=61 /DNA_END=327 /DNA_ORIENTATION=+
MEKCGVAYHAAVLGSWAAEVDLAAAFHPPPLPPPPPPTATCHLQYHRAATAVPLVWAQMVVTAGAGTGALELLEEPFAEPTPDSAAP